MKNVYHNEVYTYYLKSIRLSISNRMAQISQQISFYKLHSVYRPVLYIDSMSFSYTYETWHMLPIFIWSLFIEEWRVLSQCAYVSFSQLIRMFLYWCARVFVCVFHFIYIFFSFSLAFVSFFTQSFPWYILAVLILLISFLYWLNAERLSHSPCVIP